MHINKYLVYIIIQFAVTGCCMGPGIYRNAFYTPIEGKVVGFHLEETRGGKYGRGYTKRYPLIEYAVDSTAYQFYGVSYVSANMGSRVFILYNPDKPEDAFVRGTSNLFSGYIIYFIPFTLVWFCVIFGVGFLPTRLRIG
jgi:hypothetical protein